MIVNSHFNSTKNNVEIDGLSSCMLYFFTAFLWNECIHNFFHYASFPNGTDIMTRTNVNIGMSFCRD